MAARDAGARTVTLTVPMAPPAALSPNRRGSEHWRYRQQAAKELREAAWAAAREFLSTPSIELSPGLRKVFPMVPYEPVTIHEHIVWPKGRRLVDPDSISGHCKAALDGIVDAGIIASDSAKHVVSVTASQEKGADATGCIVITLTEAAAPDPGSDEQGG